MGILKLREGDKIIGKVAAAEGVTPDEVREAMQMVIAEGFHNSEKKEEWNKLFGENVIPTPEQFIVTMRKQVDLAMANML